MYGYGSGIWLCCCGGHARREGLAFKAIPTHRATTLSPPRRNMIYGETGEKLIRYLLGVFKRTP